MIKLVGGPLYQWDTDRKVLIENDKYQIHEVHFTNSRMNDAPVVETYEDGDDLYADIPVELLQSAGNLMCYEVTKIDGGQRTVGSSIFGIIGRSKPQDYVYTPSEVKSYDALEERIKQIEEGGSGAVEVKENEFRLIATVEPDGTFSEFEVSLDENGNPFELTEVYIYIKTDEEDGLPYQNLYVNDSLLLYYNPSVNAKLGQTIYLRLVGTEIYGTSDTCDNTDMERLAVYNYSKRWTGITRGRNSDKFKKIKFQNPQKQCMSIGEVYRIYGR